MADTNNLIEDLGPRGEKHLMANMHSDEKILVKLKAPWGQAFVVTDRHIYIVKWGYMTGNLFGGRVSAFGRNQIVGIEVKKNLATGVLEVLTAATRDAHLSYWSNKAGGAFKSNYAIALSSAKFDKFQKAAVIAREVINNF